jgi:phenylacetate-CoA ligase
LLLLFKPETAKKTIVITKTPLEAWIKKRIGVPSSMALTRKMIEDYQLAMLKTLVDRLKKQSRYYQKKLSGFNPSDIDALSDLAMLPFTTPEDVINGREDFACVSKGRISRVTTLPTSGTTGLPKRIFYTAEDQEATIDYFRWGMANLVGEGDRVLILLPGELPGSVGDLLKTALGRLGARGVSHGPIEDPLQTLNIMVKEKINVIVGMPIQVMLLLRSAQSLPHSGIRMKSILLVSDYVAQTVIDEVKARWQCDVFTHYGMTETGLGVGVQCGAFAGYHLREADLLVEIIDPETGRQKPGGEYGEVVVTTLTAQGMPLVRYRTGDVSRLLHMTCACQSIIRSLDKIIDRIHTCIRLRGGNEISMGIFDEALFALPWITDFGVFVDARDAYERLTVSLCADALPGPERIGEVKKAISMIPRIKEEIDRNELHIEVCLQPERIHHGVSKRTIRDNRDIFIKACC